MTESPFPSQPYCECGNCDATGRSGSEPVFLPSEAWAVAGDGDLTRMAVHPDHTTGYEDLPIEWHDGWAAIG